MTAEDLFIGLIQVVAGPLGISFGFLIVVLFIKRLFGELFL